MSPVWCRVEGRSRTDLKASSSVSSLSMREVRVVMVLRDREEEQGEGRQGRGGEREEKESGGRREATMLKGRCPDACSYNRLA